MLKPPLLEVTKSKMMIVFSHLTNPAKYESSSSLLVTKQLVETLKKAALDFSADTSPFTFSTPMLTVATKWIDSAAITNSV